MGAKFCKGCKDCTNKHPEHNLSRQHEYSVSNLSDPILNKNKMGISTNEIEQTNYGNTINITKREIFALTDNGRSPLYEIEDNTHYKKMSTKTINSYMNSDLLLEKTKNNNIKKIQKAFRIFKQKKDNSHQTIYEENIEIPLSEYITNLNKDELDVNLAPEQNCVYLGMKFKNKKDGLGLELFSKTNSKYFGKFRNGKRVEMGIFSIDNELKDYNYKGYIKGIYAWGYGLSSDYKKMSSYEGMWVKSLKSGYGIEKYGDKSEYIGMFFYGKKDGIGRYKWKDGSVYEGEWKENKLSGYGIYLFKDGLIYKGEWKDNKMDGIGEFSHPGVKTYIGFFKKDYRAGFGILLWYKEKKAFIGFWKNNKQEGSGKLITANKIKYGVWKDGSLLEKINSKIEFNNRLNDKEIKYLSYLKIDDYDTIYKFTERYVSLTDKNDYDSYE